MSKKYEKHSTSNNKLILEKVLVRELTLGLLELYNKLTLLQKALISCLTTAS